jgi:hypothetical protein
MPPAEPPQAVKEMTEGLEQAKISFWKLKDQMVAAEIPGAFHADWSEDLIAVAVQHTFTPDFTIRRGLCPPPPKATHSGGAAAGTPSVFQGAINRPPTSAPRSGGGAAVAHLFPPPPTDTRGVIPPISLSGNGPPIPDFLPAKAASMLRSRSSVHVSRMALADVARAASIAWLLLAISLPVQGEESTAAACAAQPPVSSPFTFRITPSIFDVDLRPCHACVHPPALSLYNL